MKREIIRIGCCGFSESQKKYFQDFEQVELQETFYQPGEESRYQRLRDKAPKNFEFVIKAWQLITHSPKSPTYAKLKIEVSPSKRENYGFFRNTKEVFRAWEKIKKIAEILRARVILFQTPASFLPTRENKKNILNFFKELRGERFIFVWEPRGWEEEEIKRVCQEVNLVHCVDIFKQRPVYGKINYFRLHGLPNYNLRYDYKKEELEKLKSFCQKEINYVFFNNIFMLKNAREFQNLV